jgi:hypothetical protein
MVVPCNGSFAARDAFCRFKLGWTEQDRLSADGLESLAWGCAAKTGMATIIASTAKVARIQPEMNTRVLFVIEILFPFGYAGEERSGRHISGL